MNKEINIYDLNLNQKMYKKIDYSNRNVNNNIKRREKNKMIIINKQKNLSAYTNSKNSHFGRILNLRKI